MRGLWLGIGSLLVLWTAWSAVTVVAPGERAVVRRFGRILDDKPGPGLYVGLPWGIDRVQRVAVNLERSVIVGWTSQEDTAEPSVTPPGQLLTGDHNLVNVRAQIHFMVIPEEVERFAV